MTAPLRLKSRPVIMHRFAAKVKDTPSGFLACAVSLWPVVPCDHAGCHIAESAGCPEPCSICARISMLSVMLVPERLK